MRIFPIVLITASIVTSALPISARPNWVLINRGDNDNAYINANMIKRKKDYVGVPVSFVSNDGKTSSSLFVVDCKNWAYMYIIGDTNSDIYPIGKDSVAEGIAEYICKS